MGFCDWRETDCDSNEGRAAQAGGGYRRFDPPFGLKGPGTVLRGTSSILDHHRRQRDTSRDPAWSEARYYSFNGLALRRDALPHRRDRRGIERIEMVTTDHGLESRGRHAAGLRLQLPRRTLPPGGTSNPMTRERAMRIGGATKQRIGTSGTFVGLLPVYCLHYRQLSKTTWLQLRYFSRPMS